MTTALAIFAKTIGFSDVKTRLAKDMGKDRAEEFYTLSIEAIEEMALKLKAQGDIVPYWALAEKEALTNKKWESFETIWTGEGCLGERQYSVLDRLLKDHSRVVIIGTDSPQFESKTIVKAIDKLKKNPEKCVIGPALDGGFYLFGSAVCISKSTWTNVSYSRKDTLKQLLKELDKDNNTYSFISEMSDVDVIEDLQVLYKDLQLTDNRRTKSQEKLFKWLKSIKNE